MSGKENTTNSLLNNREDRSLIPAVDSKGACGASATGTSTTGILPVAVAGPISLPQEEGASTSLSSDSRISSNDYTDIFPDELPTMFSFAASGCTSAHHSPAPTKTKTASPGDDDSTTSQSQNNKTQTDDSFINQMEADIKADFQDASAAMANIFGVQSDGDHAAATVNSPPKSPESTSSALEYTQATQTSMKSAVDESVINQDITRDLYGTNIFLLGDDDTDRLPAQVEGSSSPGRSPSTILRSLSSHLQDLHDDLESAEREMHAEQLQSKNQQLEQQLQDMESLLQLERERFQDQMKSEREELTTLFHHQLERVESEKELAIAEASAQAAQVVESNRKQLQAAANSQSAVDSARKQPQQTEESRTSRAAMLAAVLLLKTESDDIETELLESLEDMEDMREEKDLLRDAALALSNGNSRLQKDYDDLERELLEVLDDLEDLQEERNDASEKVDELQVQVWSLTMQGELMEEEFDEEIGLLRDEVRQHRRTILELQNRLRLEKEENIMRQVDLFQEISSHFEKQARMSVAAAEDARIESLRLRDEENLALKVDLARELMRGMKICSLESDPKAVLTGAATATVEQQSVVTAETSFISATCNLDDAKIGDPKPSVSPTLTDPSDSTKSTTAGWGATKTTPSLERPFSPKSSLVPVTTSFTPLSSKPRSSMEKDPICSPMPNAPTPKRATSVAAAAATSNTPTEPKSSAVKFQLSPNSAFRPVKDSENSTGIQSKDQLGKATKKTSSKLLKTTRRSNLMAPTASTRSRLLGREPRPSRPTQRSLEDKRPSSSGSFVSNGTKTKTRRTVVPQTEKPTVRTVSGRLSSQKRSGVIRQASESEKKSHPVIGQPIAKVRSRLPTFGGVKPAEKAGVFESKSAVRTKAPSNAQRQRKSTCSVSFKDLPAHRSKAKTPKLIRMSKSFSETKKTSPKDLIREYLSNDKQTPPKKKIHTVPTLPSTPCEMIDEAPREATPTNVGEKFENLFNVWSTAKKVRPGESLAASTPLPSKLDLQWGSTAKKAKRDVSGVNSCARKRARMECRNGTPYAAARQFSESDTPFTLRSLVSESSIDELLVSPPPVALMKSRKPIGKPSPLLTPFYARQSATSKESPLTPSSITANVTDVPSPIACKEPHLIQSRVRGFLAQKSFLNKKRAAVRIQSVARGRFAKQQMNKRRGSLVKIQSLVRRRLVMIAISTHVKMCIKIQSVWRRSMAIHCLRVESDSAIKIQSIWRASVCQSEYNALRAAALAVQPIVRGFLCRVEAKRLLQIQATRKQFAAISVQRIWRGVICRKGYVKNKLSKINAACHMQRTLRGHLGRMNASNRRCSVLRLQRLFRTVLIQGEQKKQRLSHCAALKIQSFWRRKLCTSRYNLYRGRLLLIQSVTRGVLIRMKNCQEGSAALRIQSSWRCYSKRICYRKSKVSVTMIQSVVRCRASKRELQKRRLMHHGAIAVQSLWRGKLCTSRYHLYRGQLVLLQSIARGTLIRRKHQQQMVAVIKVQSLWRCHTCSAHFANAKQSISRIQKMFRVLRKQNEDSSRRMRSMAAATIQNNWRRAQHVSSFHHVKLSILTIQSYARGYFARMKTNREVTAALMLQSWWRCYSQQMQYKKSAKTLRIQQQSAIRIQSLFRKVLSHMNYRAHVQATVAIQTRWRMTLALRNWKATRAQTIVVQSVTRRFLAKRHVEKKKIVRSNSGPVPQTKTRRLPLSMVSAANSNTRKKESTPTKVNVLSPLKTRRGKVVMRLEDKENSMSILPAITLSLPPIGGMKVVELRAELTSSHGIELKYIRKMRKAELADLLLQKRATSSS